MSSELKSETARANGAKSHGPVTPEGRAASSRNSLRHGLTAKSVVLPAESSEDFQELLDSYIDQFQPQGGVEMDLIQAMAAARWRLQRMCGIETALLSTEIVRRNEDIDEEFENMHDVDRLAFVFQKLADHGQTLALLMRYEGALNRSYDRAFKQLLLLQSTHSRPQPNEPKPTQPAPRAERPDEPAQNQPNEPMPTPSSTLVTPEIGDPIPTPAALDRESQTVPGSSPETPEPGSIDSGTDCSTDCDASIDTDSAEDS
jgi:hypothetical protein